jgi:hypothetical protein
MQHSAKATIGRAAQLKDPFCTDAFAGGDEAAAKTFQEMKQALNDKDAGPRLGFLVHLVDPFKEAVIRTVRYADAVRKWQQAQTEAGKDDTYNLAKRFEQPGIKKPELYEIVRENLGNYLREKEETLRRQHARALLLLSEVLKWVGEIHQRAPQTVSSKPLAPTYSVFYSDGQKRVPFVHDDEAGGGNPFSGLGRAYRDPAGEHFIDVARIVDFVHEPLSALPAGRAFLVENVMRANLPDDLDEKGADTESKKEGEKKEKGEEGQEGQEADAGAALFFQWWRKGLMTGIKATDEAVEYYGHRVTGTLEELEKLEKKEVRKDLSELAGKGLKAWMFAVEALNLHQSLSAFREKPDFWSAADVVGSAADAYGALLEAAPSLKERELPLFGAKLEVFAKPFEILSGAIDTAAGIHGALQAQTFGELAGQGMRGYGGALTIVAVVVGGPAAAILGLAALATVAAGSWLASKSTPWQVFLRHSKWGDTSIGDDGFDYLSNMNDFDYHEKLEDLKDDIPAQHHSLDELLWHFEPIVSLNSDHEVVLDAGNSESSFRTARWSLDLTVQSPDANESLRVYPRDPETDEDAATLDDRLNDGELLKLMALHAPNQYPDGAGEGQYAGDSFTRQKVSARAEITVDVTGDGRHILKRTVSWDGEHP